MDDKTVIANIDRYFSDTSRSPEETLAGLRAIQEEVEMKIEAIESDLED